MKDEIDKVSAAKLLAQYWGTYDQQANYDCYVDKTFMEDAIYGLGIAIDPKKYYGPEGLREFKIALREYLIANP